MDNGLQQTWAVGFRVAGIRFVHLTVVKVKSLTNTKVYSCEYQLTAASYFAGSGPLVQNGLVPFYPAPDSASAGACCQSSALHIPTDRLTFLLACNHGHVYGNLTEISTDTACTAVASTGDFTTLYACECCQFSWPISKWVH